MKFISSSYDEVTGISKVVVQHLGVKFTGWAHAHPEEQYPSNFAGCEYAEIRAEIAALKYERKLEKNKADMAIDFLKSCKNYKNFDDNSDTAKVIYRQLNKRVQKVNNITDEINKRLRQLEMAVKKREITLKAIERRRRTKEEN